MNNNDIEIIVTVDPSETPFTVDMNNNVVDVSVPDTREDEIGAAIAALNNAVATLSATALDIFYPIGSYYETSDGDFDPNTTWGGTWELEAEGLVHIGAGTHYSLGATGGEAKVTLTANESGVQGHTHDYFHSHANFGVLPRASAGHSWTADNGNSISGSAHKYIYTDADAGLGSLTTIGNPSSTVTQANIEKNAVSPHNNMQPYVVIKRWHRTA